MSNIALNYMFRKKLNFRELGGYRTQDGRHVKENVFFRSARLDHLNTNELRAIKKLGIKTIVDLRSEEEVNKHPDPVMSGISYYKMSALKDEKGEDINYSPSSILKKALRQRDKNIAQATLEHFYALMIFNNGTFTKLMNMLKEEHTPILFHCTAGKDRTGIASILILLLLGVSEESIRKDYLLTNKYRKKALNKQHRRFKLLTHFSNNVSDIVTLSEGVLPEGCDYIFNLIHQRYSSYEEYFEQEMHISKEEQKRIREKYLK